MTASAYRVARGVSVFVLVYCLLGLGAVAGLGFIGADTPWYSAILVYAVAAPCAVWFGLYSGRLTVASVALGSLFLMVGMYLTIVAVLYVTALGVAPEADWIGAYQLPLSAGLFVNTCATVMVPVIWLLLMHRLTGR